MTALLWLLACPPPTPNRVILIAVDTLRPDHLGVYGYPRDTSLPLDHWAKDSIVLEQARSVAPWTLPAMQSALTGRQPEQYHLGPTLPELLQAQGWTTALIGANTYLSKDFSMDRGWDLHQVQPSSNATQQVDLALDWLEKHPQKSLLLLHLIDAHLPYQEPPPYRTRYTRTEEPNTTNKLARKRSGLPEQWSPSEQEYLRDRYDNNIAYIHDQLQRLFSALSPRDMVVYFSDHGEEFFEHGGYEHGHTLYEELIRVPLLIKVPGLTGQRIAEPVSLLDIPPTVLDALNMPYSGVSLLELARGNQETQQQAMARPIGFGRLLYGPQQWAVVQAGVKYTSQEGVEKMYHIKNDPVEANNILIHEDLSSWRARLSEAVGFPVTPGYRLVFVQGATALSEDLVVEVGVDGGIPSVWTSERISTRQWVQIHQAEHSVQVIFRAGARGSFEVFFNPRQRANQLLLQLPGIAPLSTHASEIPVGGSRQPFLKIFLDETRTLSIKPSIHPAFPSTNQASIVLDPATEQALRALGYL